MTTKTRWLPNQHGAWAILAGPVILGIGAVGFAWSQVALVPFWFVGYLWFFALSLWLKSRFRPRFRKPVIVYGAIAAALGVLSAFMEPLLLVWAPFFMTLLGYAVFMVWLRRDRSLAAGLAEVMASALFVVPVMATVRSYDIERAFLLAGVFALYELGVLVYVKTMIRERGDRGYFQLSVWFHAFATLIVLMWLPSPVAALFALLTLRAALGPRLKLSPLKVGVAEVVWMALVIFVELWLL